MDEYLRQLEILKQRGAELKRALSEGSASSADLAGWQRDCGACVNHLSGGSKAHWLSRAYSGAFLLRSTADRLVVEATAGDIVDRLLDVLEQARTSLSSVGANAASSAERDDAAPARRFDFVHNIELRPVLMQAYGDSRRAFEEGQFGQSLIMSCSILEALITDRLETRLQAGGLRLGTNAAGTQQSVHAWSFDRRIDVAEQNGLIRGGCARLPPVARRYRDLTDAHGDLRPDVTVSERDAKVTRQVLHVVLRDLDPGR